MALIKCKECGAEVSSKAETCPKCGAQVADKPMGCGTAVGILFLGLIIIAVFTSFSPSVPVSSTPDAEQSAASTTSSQTVAMPESNLPGSQWTFYHHEDAMKKGDIYQAQVSSSNTVDFSFPYSGAQHATLMLRTHPRYGKDLIFSIEKGQFLCPSYDGCNVLVRFDDGEAVNFSAAAPEDNSTDTIFIRNYSRFVEKMLKAKRVRIAANIYQEGAPVFEFDVSGFDPTKYKQKS
jgi:hypothetical protein